MHNLVVRENYHSIPVEEWTLEELLAWLIDEGAYSCGIETGCIPEELMQEVILQAGEIGFPLIRAAAH